MSPLDHAILWLAVRFLHLRFPVCLVHVTKIEKVWRDERGEEKCRASNHTRARCTADTKVVRHHLAGLLDSAEDINTKVEVSDLIHELDTTTTPESPTP